MAGPLLRNGFPAVASADVVVVPIVELERTRPDSLGMAPFKEKFLFGVALLVVAGLLAVPFEALSRVTPKAAWGPLFLAWAYVTLKLFGYVSDPFVRKRELHLMPDVAVIVSSEPSEQCSLAYDDVDEIIVFDDEWYNGSRTLHWRGVVLERRGEVPVELELGEHTARVVEVINQRVKVAIKRERKVWPAAPEFD